MVFIQREKNVYRIKGRGLEEGGKLREGEIGKGEIEGREIGRGGNWEWGKLKREIREENWGEIGGKLSFL
jgi:hypothetical protein